VALEDLEDLFISVLLLVRYFLQLLRLYALLKKYVVFYFELIRWMILTIYCA
jgi:hypothetical protein